MRRCGLPGQGRLAVILAQGYIPHVVSRKSEAEQKKRDPAKKARRCVVDACHGWFNWFRKLLVRYEKLEHTFLALRAIAFKFCRYCVSPFSLVTPRHEPA